MSKVPQREDFVTLDEWVAATVESTEIEEELLWAIVEEFKPGAQSMTGGEKEVKLLNLLEHHHQKLIEAGDDPSAAPFINFYFPVDGEVVSYHQFQWGAYNAVSLNDEESGKFHNIIDDENLDIMLEDDDHITATDYEWTPEEALRVSSRILTEVFEVTLEDIERAVEVDGKTGEEVSWTDV